MSELKADYKEACVCLQTANLIKDEQIAAALHHKYKRCLAMAKWCEMCHRELLTRACLPTKQNWNRHDEWRYFVNFWHRYEYRFRKLAEKFKEAK